MRIRSAKHSSGRPRRTRLRIENLEARSLLSAGPWPGGSVVADADLPLVTIAAVADGAEGGDPGVVRISRTGSTSAPLAVSVGRSGTAAFGPKGDYTLDVGGVPYAGKSIVIPEGQASVDVAVTAVDDLVAEPAESVILTLRKNSRYNLDPVAANRAATVRIFDNEPVVGIAASDPQASEIDGESSGKGAFTIHRSDGKGALTVKFTRSGAAKSGRDCVLRCEGAGADLKANEITLADGQSSAVIEVIPKNDAAQELVETVVLKLKSAKQYSVDPAGPQATVSIANNAAPTFTAVEPLSGTQNIPVLITYESLLADSNAVDPEGSAVLFRIVSVKSGSLRKENEAVKANSTTLGPGERLVWTPKVNAVGKTAALAVKATDGAATSSRAVTVPVNLASLDGLPDAAEMLAPGEGLNALQYSPTGTLARLLWTDVDTLVYSERQADGTWASQTIAGDSLSGEDWSDPRDPRDYEQAQLLFAPNGVPHVVLTDGSSVWHLFRQGGTWEDEQIVPSVGDDFGGFDGVFSAAMGPSGALHVAMTDNDWGGTPGIVCGTNASGAWSFQRVCDLLGDRMGLYRQTGTYARYFGLAVDAQDKAHIVYTPEFVNEPVVGGTRVYSELAYATNRSGTWTTQTVFSPPDGTGDAGLAASIAVDPATNRPAIASFFVDRVGTGSPSSGKLLYHTLQADGTWTHTTVASSSDGYKAGDGNQGTGFAPKLIFDGSGRANILFCDYASQHFAGFGADEFAGQLRHARLDGNHWNIQTVFRQTDPIRNYLIYPTMAIYGDEVSYMAIWKHDKLAADSRVIDSTYRLVEFTLPLLV